MVVTSANAKSVRPTFVTALHAYKCLLTAACCLLSCLLTLLTSRVRFCQIVLFQCVATTVRLERMISAVKFAFVQVKNVFNCKISLIQYMYSAPAHDVLTVLHTAYYTVPPSKS